MALKQSDMVAVVRGASALTLQMEANESARVKGIDVYATTPVAEAWEVNIDRKLVASIVAPINWHVLSHDQNNNVISIGKSLMEMGMFPLYPVAAGEEFRVNAPAATEYLEVTYDLFDAGDVSPEERNGSASKDYRFLQFISNSAIVTAAGDAPLNQSDISAIFPAFPGGATVPAQTRITLLAMFGAGAGQGDAAVHTQDTTRLQGLRERQHTFDQDRAGLVYQGSQTTISATVSYDSEAGSMWLPADGRRAGIRVLAEPTVFDPGEELNIIATVDEDAAGGDFAAGEIVLGLLLDVDRSAV